jgi:hypothetical protein
MSWYSLYQLFEKAHLPNCGTDSSTVGSSSRLQRWTGAGYTSLSPDCWYRLYQLSNLLAQLVKDFKELEDILT